jgi:hypothetical protein
VCMPSAHVGIERTCSGSCFESCMDDIVVAAARAATRRSPAVVCCRAG